MSACTFFGYRECPESVKEELRTAIVELIDQGVDTFYVGNQGQLDAMVRNTLRQLCAEYPHIRYAVVLAYLPGQTREYEDTRIPCTRRGSKRGRSSSPLRAETGG